METIHLILKILGIYSVGAIIAFVLSAFYISVYRTKDSPFIGALFSWITVLIVIIANIKNKRHD